MRLQQESIEDKALKYYENIVRLQQESSEDKALKHT